MEVTSTRPRVLLIIDKPNWAFHTIARAMEKHLSDAFSFDILITTEDPLFDDRDYEIVHVFFETETVHRPFLSGHAKVVKSVYSHYWELNGQTPQEFYDQYLAEADIVTVPNLKLLRTLSTVTDRIALCPEGVDPTVFHPAHLHRSGPIVVGWAGCAERPVKRIDWLKSACEGLCTLRLAEGDLTEEQMVQFYQEIDVIACSSKAEGAPRPLLEGMASGNFPVSFDVGIARELITSGQNGLIVTEESIEGLRAGVQWCVDHPAQVRMQAEQNPPFIQIYRDWKKTTQEIAKVYHSLL